MLRTLRCHGPTGLKRRQRRHERVALTCPNAFASLRWHLTDWGVQLLDPLHQRCVGIDPLQHYWSFTNCTPQDVHCPIQVPVPGSQAIFLTNNRLPRGEYPYVDGQERPKAVSSIAQPEKNLQQVRLNAASCNIFHWVENNNSQSLSGCASQQS